jgi:hypothetical protein
MSLWLLTFWTIELDHAFLKQVIEQKPNGGQVLPLGSDAARVPL